MTGKARKIMMVMTAPILSLAMLGGIVAEKQSYITPRDAEPYHRRAKEAIESFPYTDTVGYWTGSDEKVPEAAIKLLRPNAILSRLYVDNTPQMSSRMDRRANLLIVQCRDSRDMLGHYPPVCYPAHGMTMARKVPRDWQIGATTIKGMEYEFVQTTRGQTYRQVVYNFLIVPGVGIVRDMEGVSAAAEDYQQRFYGAAQFQVVMDGELPAEQRDEVFTTLLGADLSILKTVEQIKNES